METTWLNAQDADFDAKLAALTAWSEERDEEVADRVRGILRDVAKRGDAALVEYTNRFDRRDVAAMDALVVGHDQLQAALERIPAEQRQALEAAAERVRRYHEKQKQDSWQYREADGTLLGQQVTPLDRAGIYVPGGKAAYPSSVLMNALPAKVAGVGEIIMVSPAPDGEINDMVLAAAAIAGLIKWVRPPRPWRPWGTTRRLPRPWRPPLQSGSPRCPRCRRNMTRTPGGHHPSIQDLVNKNRAVVRHE